MRGLLQKLVLFGALPPTADLLGLYPPDTFCLGAGDGEVATLSQLRAEVPLCETFNRKKICKYNAAVELLATFKVRRL